MDSKKNSKITNKCSGIGVKFYQEKIIEMINQIEDTWILNQIYKFVINMTEEGD